MLIMYVRLLKNKDHLSTVRIKSINMSSESLNTLRQLYNNELGILLWRRFHTCTCILVVLYRSVILKRGNERPKKIRSTVLYAFLQHFEICIWLCPFYMHFYSILRYVFGCVVRRTFQQIWSHALHCMFALYCWNFDFG